MLSSSGPPPRTLNGVPTSRSRLRRWDTTCTWCRPGRKRAWNLAVGITTLLGIHSDMLHCISQVPMIHAQNFSLGVNLMFKVITTPAPHNTISAASRYSSQFLCDVLTSRRHPQICRLPRRSQILSVKTLTSRLSRGECPVKSCRPPSSCGLFVLFPTASERFHGEQKSMCNSP